MRARVLAAMPGINYNRFKAECAFFEVSCLAVNELSDMIRASRKLFSETNCRLLKGLFIYLGFASPNPLQRRGLQCKA
jgi:hypothetical protein